MTSLEKYKDEILNCNNPRADFCSNFIKPKILHTKEKNCDTIGCAFCKLISTIWLAEEYKEPEEPDVDWSKVPVDTKIYIKKFEGETWKRRYFAKYENGKVYTWSGGSTSWSCEEKEKTHWKYAKLEEVE